MTWTKLDPLEGEQGPCLNCPPIREKLNMVRLIAVGFGYAACTRDGEEILSEPTDLFVTTPTVADAEALAELDPDHDWRIVLHGPLHGETYQRHGADEWMLVERNKGFA